MRHKTKLLLIGFLSVAIFRTYFRSFCFIFLILILPVYLAQPVHAGLVSDAEKVIKYEHLFRQLGKLIQELTLLDSTQGYFPRVSVEIDSSGPVSIMVHNNPGQTPAMPGTPTTNVDYSSIWWTIPSNESNFVSAFAKASSGRELK